MKNLTKLLVFTFIFIDAAQSFSGTTMECLGKQKHDFIKSVRASNENVRSVVKRYTRLLDQSSSVFVTPNYYSGSNLNISDSINDLKKKHLIIEVVLNDRKKAISDAYTLSGILDNLQIDIHDSEERDQINDDIMLLLRGADIVQAIASSISFSTCYRR